VLNFNKIGIVAWLFSGILLIFQIIASFINEKTEYAWKNYRIIDFLTDEQLEWIDGIAGSSVQNAADSVIEAPLMIVLFLAGLFFFLAGAIFSKR